LSCDCVKLLDFMFLSTILLFILAEYFKMTIVKKKENVLRENKMVNWVICVLKWLVPDSGVG